MSNIFGLASRTLKGVYYQCLDIFEAWAGEISFLSGIPSSTYPLLSSSSSRVSMLLRSTVTPP